MKVLFNCVFEGWDGIYNVVDTPAVGHRIHFPHQRHKSGYEVTHVQHFVTQGKDDPQMVVIIRPTGLGQIARLPRPANVDPDLYAIDPDMEVKRVNELATHDYRE